MRQKEEKALIKVKNLVKSYEGHLAVDNLSFSVEQGKILGFLGPNGAGKSTTMNIMTGYISATDGEVTIDGYDILEEPEEAKKAIGYLPEIPPLYLDMTVKEYLKFAAEIKGVKRKDQEQALGKVMNLTKTTDVADRLIKHLSKGYRQRVGLAQALVGEPKVLILDEPMVGLDPQQIIEMRDLIRNLSKDHAIILSSHILSEVSAICDEVMIINRGKLVVSDTPDNLARHMENQEMVHLEVKGERHRVSQVLNNVSGITKVEQEGERDGICRLTVYCGDNDLRESIFYALAEAKCPIMDMHISNRSLEDIFLELTGRDSGKKRRRILEKSEQELVSEGEEE
jgi:ABC-2 type transport system ATP-binding protein